jgi:hypothetical protein
MCSLGTIVGPLVPHLARRERPALGPWLKRDVDKSAAPCGRDPPRGVPARRGRDISAEAVEQQDRGMPQVLPSRPQRIAQRAARGAAELPDRRLVQLVGGRPHTRQVPGRIPGLIVRTEHPESRRQGRALRIVGLLLARGRLDRHIREGEITGTGTVPQDAHILQVPLAGPPVDLVQDLQGQEAQRCGLRTRPVLRRSAGPPQGHSRAVRTVHGPATADPRRGPRRRGTEPTPAGAPVRSRRTRSVRTAAAVLPRPTARRRAGPWGRSPCRRAAARPGSA